MASFTGGENFPPSFFFLPLFLRRCVSFFFLPNKGENVSFALSALRMRPFFFPAVSSRPGRQRVLSPFFFSYRSHRDEPFPSPWKDGIRVTPFFSFFLVGTAILSVPFSFFSIIDDGKPGPPLSPAPCFFWVGAGGCCFSFLLFFAAKLPFCGAEAISLPLLSPSEHRDEDYFLPFFLFFSSFLEAPPIRALPPLIMMREVFFTPFFLFYRPS